MYQINITGFTWIVKRTSRLRFHKSLGFMHRTDFEELIYYPRGPPLKNRRVRRSQVVSLRKKTKTNSKEGEDENFKGKREGRAQKIRRELQRDERGIRMQQRSVAASAASAAGGGGTAAGPTATARRRCEGTAMGSITLDLRPGLGIGPFTLGIDPNLTIFSLPLCDYREDYLRNLKSI